MNSTVCRMFLMCKYFRITCPLEAARADDGCGDGAHDKVVAVEDNEGTDMADGDLALLVEEAA